MPRRLVVLTALLIACGGRPVPDEPVTVDLLHLFRVSDGGPRTNVVDLAGPAESHRLLWGWGETVTAPDGTQARWLVGAQAALAFRAGSDPGDAFLSVDRVLVAPPGPHRPPEGVRVFVNGVFVGRLAPNREHVELPVAASALKHGRNLLSFRVIKRPHEDPKRPTAPYLYRALRFRYARPERPEATLAGTDALALPAESGASFFFRSPGDARLRAGVRGSGGRLRVRAHTDGTTRDLLDRAVGGEAEIDLPLGTAPGDIVQLDLHANAPVTLVHPRVDGGGRPATTPLAAGPRRDWNVILYVVDTLRADALGLYGGARPTSPRLDRFAEGAVVFERTVAQSAWTRPSVASMLTGMHPSAHGVLSIGDRLSARATLLSELLGEAGYDTAAFVTNVNVTGPFGFKRGFATFQYLPEEPKSRHVYASAAALHDALLAWIGEPRARPFFVYAHASDPHAPYRPPSDTAARFVRPDAPASLNPADPMLGLRRRVKALSPDDAVYLRSLYDAEVAAFDAELGRLLDALGQDGLLDRTVVVIVGDHGEEFLDHGGLEHGKTLYQELLHVPLIVRVPGGTGARTTVLAQHVDVAPTLLSLLGLPAPGGVAGHALLAPDGAVVPASQREAFSSTRFGDAALMALVVPPWKVVVPERGDARPQVFDLERDPAERENLEAAHPVLVGYARQRMAELEAEGGYAPRGDPRLIDPETRERLRHLGYVVD
jgi:arylsulfatase A-like enzyme